MVVVSVLNAIVVIADRAGAFVTAMRCVVITQIVVIVVVLIGYHTAWLTVIGQISWEVFFVGG